MASSVRDLYVNVRCCYDIRWKVLKSHSGLWQNDRCDVMAKKGAKGFRRELPLDRVSPGGDGETNLVFQYDSDLEL